MLTASVEVRSGETTEVVLGQPAGPPTRIEGRVTRGGEPLREAIVTFAGIGSGVDVHGTRTDAEGRYELELPGGRNYAVNVGTGANFVSYSVVHSIPAAASHRIDLELPSGSVHGRIFAPSGEPAQRTTVALRPEDAFAEGAPAVVYTDAEGRFEVESLPGGTYTLRAGVQHALANEPLGTATVEGIHVDAGQRVGPIELHLAHAGSVRGTVRRANGKPATEATIYVFDHRGSAVMEASPWHTDQAGRFEVHGLEPGPIAVLAREAGTSSAIVDTQIQADEGVELDLALEEAGHLRVVVLSEDEEPPPVHLRVLDAQGRDVAQLSGPENWASSMTRGTDTVLIGPLPPGRYRVEAITNDGRSHGRSVTLRAGRGRTVKMRLR